MKQLNKPFAILAVGLALTATTIMPIMRARKAHILAAGLALAATAQAGTITAQRLGHAGHSRAGSGLKLAWGRISNT